MQRDCLLGEELDLEERPGRAAETARSRINAQIVHTVCNIKPQMEQSNRVGRNYGTT
jgi:hypothetical protein